MKESNHARSVGHGKDLCVYTEIIRSSDGLQKGQAGAGWSPHRKMSEVIKGKHLGGVPGIKLLSLSSNSLFCMMHCGAEAGSLKTAFLLSTAGSMIGSANRKCQKEPARLKQEEGICPCLSASRLCEHHSWLTSSPAAHEQQLNPLCNVFQDLQNQLHCPYPHSPQLTILHIEIPLFKQFLWFLSHKRTLAGIQVATAALWQTVTGRDGRETGEIQLCI